jgi:hypothetical protein
MVGWPISSAQIHTRLPVVCARACRLPLRQSQTRPCVRIAVSSTGHVEERASSSLTQRRRAMLGTPGHDGIATTRSNLGCSWMPAASCFVIRDLVWVKRGQLTPHHHIQHLSVAVHVWGVIWDTGSIFAQYQGHLNSRKMYNLLMDHLASHAPGLIGRTLLADGARYQWTAEVKEWYESACIAALKLPPHSPQFNAIERAGAGSSIVQSGMLRRHCLLSGRR